MPDFENSPEPPNTVGQSSKFLTIAIGIAMMVFGIVGLFSPIGAPEKIFSAFFLAGGALTLPVFSGLIAKRFTFYASPWAQLAVAALSMVIGTAVFLTLEWIERM
jgi:hypothetical protein